MVRRKAETGSFQWRNGVRERETERSKSLWVIRKEGRRFNSQMGRMAFYGRPWHFTVIIFSFHGVSGLLSWIKFSFFGIISYLHRAYKPLMGFWSICAPSICAPSIFYILYYESLLRKPVLKFLIYLPELFFKHKYFNVWRKGRRFCRPVMLAMAEVPSGKKKQEAGPLST